MVDHEFLLVKLKTYGVTSTSLSWFRSYLHDRRQLVTIAGKESEYVQMSHGIPQGSIVGPLLFIIFINDLPLYINSSQVDLYADVSNMVKLQSVLNESLEQNNEWATSNKLPINKEKTKALIITGKRLNSKIDKSKCTIQTKW